MVTEQQADHRTNGAGSRSSGLADRLDGAMTAIERWRDQPLLAVGLGGTVLIIAAMGWWFGRSDPVVPVEAGIPYVTTTAASGAASTADGSSTSGGSPGGTPPAGPLLLHVAGEVVNPGIVEVDPDARVVDAVEAAGGPTGDADLDQLNLAAPVSDGVQIRVPAVGETVSSPFGMSDGGGGGAGSQPGLVDINQSTAAELEQLPGIGPALATAIVRWRTENGPFSTLEGLLDVPGIGPSKLDGLSDAATL